MFIIFIKIYLQLQLYIKILIVKFTHLIQIFFKMYYLLKENLLYGHFQLH